VVCSGTNNWGPAGYFWSLPQQLWPYIKGDVHAYDVDEATHSALPSTGPPTSGVWQAHQIVLAALNSSVEERGWACVEGGKPGRWQPLR
jgi:hypothetical protein